MEFFSSGSRIVDTIGKWDYSGTVIPHIWFSTIVNDKHKTQYLSIVILADIVYWYRPVEVRDEFTGQVIGWKKKFRADFLQRSYQQMSDYTGENIRTVRRAVDCLVSLGVVKRHKRTLKYANGNIMRNVLYIELVPEKLYELTYPQKENIPQVPASSEDFGYGIVEMIEEDEASEPENGYDADSAYAPDSNFHGNPLNKTGRNQSMAIFCPEDDKKVFGSEQKNVKVQTQNCSVTDRKMFDGGQKNGIGQTGMCSTGDAKMSVPEQSIVLTNAGSGQTNTKITTENSTVISAKNTTESTNGLEMDGSFNPSIYQAGFCAVDYSGQTNLNQQYRRREGRSLSPGGFENPEILEMQRLISVMRTNVRYDLLMEFWNRNKTRENEINRIRFEELYNLMVEVICTRTDFVHINGRDIAYFEVRDRFLRLSDQHLMYVIESMKNTHARIANIKAYMLMCLFNSVSTIQTDVEQQYLHDFPISGNV